MTKALADRADLWFDSAKGGDVDTIRSMLAGGFDPNARDPKHGHSALIHAAACGSAAVARIVLAAGADPLLPNGSGDIASDYAIRGGHLDVLRLLITPDYVEVRTSGGFTPLLWCAYRGRIDCLRHVISLGADLDAVDDSGHGAPTMCALKGDFDTLRVLAEAGGSLAASEDGENDPLRAADARRISDIANYIKAWRERQAIDAASNFGPARNAAPRI